VAALLALLSTWALAARAVCAIPMVWLFNVWGTADRPCSDVKPRPENKRRVDEKLVPHGAGGDEPSDEQATRRRRRPTGGKHNRVNANAVISAPYN
jgi:hypothetical protein